MERYVAFGLKHPDHYLPTFVLPLPGTMDADDLRKTADSNGMRCFGCLRDCIAAGVKAKKLRKVDPEVAARAAWAGIHGVTSLLIVHDHFPWGDKKAVIAATIDAFIGGLRRP